MMKSNGLIKITINKTKLWTQYKTKQLILGQVKHLSFELIFIECQLQLKMQETLWLSFAECKKEEKKPFFRELIQWKMDQF